MIIIADCGSTKTDWTLCDDKGNATVAKTQGFNPSLQGSEEILAVLSEELPSGFTEAKPEKIFFYGAGCAYEAANARIKTALNELFTAEEVHINSDLLAAARALCGKEEGIACILGTGSNSCLYDGKKIVDNTPSMGYILGDEGSGANLGRQFLSDCVKKQMPKEIRDKFMERYELDIPTILEKVYRSPMPNRWLASFTPFIHEHKNNAEVNAMLKQCFRQFFQRNVMVYRRSWLPIHVIGGIGINFSDEIKESAESLGLSIGNFVQSPMEGLIKYHCNN
jgi:N-acetylglucosamine kinase-like BadF-type ATPase